MGWLSVSAPTTLCPRFLEVVTNQSWVGIGVGVVVDHVVVVLGVSLIVGVGVAGVGLIIELYE
jgi:hypothetical protein